MQLLKGQLVFSPSDLITFMESPYASWMERKKLEDPSILELMDEKSEFLTTLQKMGYAHEDAYTDSLKNDGVDVLEIERASPDQMAALTLEAMKAGRDTIVQGYLSHGRFAGMADYLKKVPGRSNFGDYHYEIWDTKLSKKLKPYFAIQLCCYTEMLEALQGVRPESFAVVLGDQAQESLRVDDYFSYYKFLKASFLAQQDTFDPSQEPDPAESRAHGRWSDLASARLEERDHLSQVANITRLQIKRLEDAEIGSMQRLADSTCVEVPKVGEAIFSKLKAQAAIQISSRGKATPDYQILTHQDATEGEEAMGLALLPCHSDLDVFFDIEGFPLVDGGLEYLWGCTFFDEEGERQFRDFWAHDQQQEKQAFTDFIDWVYARWKSDPTMHVYHYASYEVTAVRKLMGRYGVCETKVDNLLRNNVFVDLYKVVSHGLLIGEPRYSIKNVEHIYRGKRDTDVAGGDESIVVYEAWRNNPDGETWETSKILKSIRDYNIDDCDSTQELASWLRSEQEKHGIAFSGPTGEGEAEVPDEVTETTEFRDALLNPVDDTVDKNQSHMLETLAWTLEFHRREDKPTWWRFFDRLGLSEPQLYDDMDCLAGLVRTETEPYLPSPRARNKVYEYAFNPDQPFKGKARQFKVLGADGPTISCLTYDPERGLIGFQHREPLPKWMNVIPMEHVRPEPIPSAILSVAKDLGNPDHTGSAISDFLLRKRPRISGNELGPILQEKEDRLEEATDAVSKLDNSYLCIQGPPGTGKTYTASHVIAKLMSDGKRVGITSNAHDAIHNLMEALADLVAGEATTLIKFKGNEDDPIFERGDIHRESNYDECYQRARQPGTCVGGTAWVFCNKVFSPEENPDGPVFDYLFIDEAGQVSVANLIGMSRSCKNLILMGDQMQLAPVVQGSHPGDSGLSALEYLLQGHATIPDDLGIFLPETYRMHPEVCSLVSNQVYEGRLQSHKTAHRHSVETKGPMITKKAGISFVPVEHFGNAQASEEEVAVVKELMNELLGSAYWPKEAGGKDRTIGWQDILIVAPYNYQVNKLKAALGGKARVGTVDKFQGQEAPIVIVSMSTSDATESPRGIDFLFSKNRLNVAVSRAQALAIVVGSPRLATTAVNSVDQMALVNFFCRIVEEGEAA